MYSRESVIAGTAFVLFSVLGVAAQLWKIWRRVSEQQATGTDLPGYATKGLVPFREFMAFLFFFLFFCSGLTRTQLDTMLVGTRLPAVLIQAAIVAAVYLDRRARWPKLFLILTSLLSAFGVFLFIGRTSGGLEHAAQLGQWIDWSLLALLFPFIWARLKHAHTVWHLSERSVSSAYREIGCILKDLTGSWYALTGIGELFFVLLSHLSTIGTSIAILIAISKNRRSTPEPKLSR